VSEQTPEIPEATESEVETLGSGNPGEGPSREDVLEVLKMVIDPELGINVVDLGLVYDVEVDDDEVAVTYTLTSMGCPVGPLIEQQIQQVVTTLPGVGVVRSTMTFDPPWSMEKMSEDARLAMGMF
jgi:metal-sulfur cluster biosynthetic enzyme